MNINNPTLPEYLYKKNILFYNIYNNIDKRNLINILDLRNNIIIWLGFSKCSKTPIIDNVLDRLSFKTSIILCTYNEANYIENAISELEKKIPDLEIVIVDDSSSDGTIEIIERLNKNNKYKAIFRKRSRNLASAFVRGLTETTGGNFGWIDTNLCELAP